MQPQLLHQPPPTSRQDQEATTTAGEELKEKEKQLRVKQRTL
jgi:hypothetical protein